MAPVESPDRSPQRRAFEQNLSFTPGFLTPAADNLSRGEMWSRTNSNKSASVTTCESSLIQTLRAEGSLNDRGVFITRDSQRHKGTCDRRLVGAVRGGGAPGCPVLAAQPCPLGSPCLEGAGQVFLLLPAVSGGVSLLTVWKRNPAGSSLPRNQCAHTQGPGRESAYSGLFLTQLLSASLRSEGRAGVPSSRGVVFLQWPSSLTPGTSLSLEVFKILCLIMILLGVCVCICSLCAWS